MTISDMAPPAPSLDGFTLDDLAPFKASGFLPGASPHFRLFHAGRDDIHAAICYLLKRARHSLAFSMYGYDDEELNAIILDKMTDTTVSVTGTLDKSQAGGIHEKKLLELDRARLGAEFNTRFAIGQSEYGHQILHTKGFIIDNVVGCEGSVNWSASGEGTFVGGAHQAGGVGYRAQANTLSVFMCPASIGEFAAVLDRQHRAAVQQMAKTT